MHEIDAPHVEIYTGPPCKRCSNVHSQRPVTARQAGIKSISLSLSLSLLQLSPTRRGQRVRRVGWSVVEERWPTSILSPVGRRHASSRFLTLDLLTSPTEAIWSSLFSWCLDASRWSEEVNYAAGEAEVKC